MRSTDGEVALMREQLARGSGIYGCDEWAVLSDKKIWLSPGPPTRLDSTVIAADLNATGDGISTKYKNSKQFLRAWERIKEDGKYKGMDWVVKVDPDTVFFPQRLKHHLTTKAQDPSHAKFFANCRTDDHPHFMFGALEVFSAAAAEEFFKHGARCEKELKSEEMWEERYVSHCLQLLKVEMDPDFDLLHDEHCDLKRRPLMPCVDNDAVAFHPLRSPSEYFTCRGQAQQSWEDSQKEKEDKKKHDDEDKDVKAHEKSAAATHAVEKVETEDEEDKRHEKKEGAAHKGEKLEQKEENSEEKEEEEEKQDDSKKSDNEGKHHGDAQDRKRTKHEDEDEEEEEGKKQEEVEAPKKQVSSEKDDVETHKDKAHSEAKGSGEEEKQRREDDDGETHEVEAHEKHDAHEKLHSREKDTRDHKAHHKGDDDDEPQASEEAAETTREATAAKAPSRTSGEHHEEEHEKKEEEGEQAAKG
mmetsp:Transcript_30595/g.80507  ORF Transcript_30595/g.80507 Transcript_30595/m.80507 type:complete len:472 (+) Transcript_30595:441-1856(+)